jgi:hypothetical protein
LELSSIATNDIYYHATHIENLPLIKSQGLVTTAKSRYPETRPGFIYLYTDPGMAYYWGHSKYGNKRLILQVKVDPSTLRVDPLADGAVMTDVPIAPEKIRFLPRGGIPDSLRVKSSS